MWLDSAGSKWKDQALLLFFFFHLQLWACELKQSVWQLERSLSCEAGPSMQTTTCLRSNEMTWLCLISTQPIEADYMSNVFGVLIWVSCALWNKDFERTADMRFLPFERLMKRCCSPLRTSLSSCPPVLLLKTWMLQTSHPLDFQGSPSPSRSFI